MLLFPRLLLVLGCVLFQVCHGTFSNTRSSVDEIEVPATGFVRIQTTDGQKHVLRTLKKHHKSSLCHTFSLEDQPFPNPSPLMGSNRFSLLPDLYNEHFGWSNGMEYITFVPFDSSHGKGNWLLGVEPGVDSGYVYLGATSSSVTPIDNDIDSKSPWKWLINGKWEDQPQMRAYCLDEEQPADEYFEAEYFDPELPDEIQTSHLLPKFPEGLLENALGFVFSDLHSFHCTDSYILWLPNRGKYACVRPLEIIAIFGQPMRINHNLIKGDEMGMLTGVEHAQDSSWRLTFHLLGSTLADTSVSTSVNGVSTARSGTNVNNSKSYRIDEFLIELQRDGTLRDGHSLAMLSTAQIHDQITHIHSSLRDVVPGEYLWMWQAIDENMEDNLDFGLKGKEQSTTELFVKCIARSENILVFQAYPTHRMELMTQTMTSKYLTYLLQINLQDFQSDDTEIDSLPGTLAGQAIQISSMMFLGKHVIGYLHEHLLYKDKKVNGMSSCFFYHAAVSFPAALLYAAELLCVLIGAKPVAMVQMHSNSEHQWKFPFVLEITQNAVKNIELSRHNNSLASALNLDYRVFTYLHDETLVLYRTEHRVLMESIKPAMTAQALHPMPFPDEDNLLLSWREQIYNAAWNGFVLGYPEHFIRSYCEDFSNGLDVEDKREEYAQAKADVTKHLEKVAKKKNVEIGMGLTTPLTNEGMKIILGDL